MNLSRNEVACSSIKKGRSSATQSVVPGNHLVGPTVASSNLYINLNFYLFIVQHAECSMQTSIVRCKYFNEFRSVNDLGYGSHLRVFAFCL